MKVLIKKLPTNYTIAFQNKHLISMKHKMSCMCEGIWEYILSHQSTGTTMKTIKSMLNTQT